MDFDAWYESLEPSTRDRELLVTPATFSRKAFNAGLDQALLTYDQLSPKQRDYARQWHYQGLLREVAEGHVTFGDPAIKDGVAKAEAQCERLRTPWFLSTYIEDSIGGLLMQIAMTEAQGAHYLNPQLDLYVANCVIPQD
jgi:hypothetical protein